MSEQNPLKPLFEEIANAIREKDGTTALIQDASNFPARIRAIPVGGLSDDVHTITVEASDPEGGEVSGGGSASEGMRVVVSAESAETYNFIGWNEGGSQVSTDKDYSFSVSKDTILTAEFELKSGHDLPLPYKECVYIIPKGRSQLLIQKYPFSSKTKVFVDVEFSDLKDSYVSIYFLGSYTYYGSSTTYLFNFTLSAQINSTTKELYYDGIRGLRSSTASSSLTRKNLSIPVVPGRVVMGLDNELGGAHIGDEFESFGNSNTTTTNMILFNSHSPADYYQPVDKIYGAKIYEGDEIKYDFIPCVNGSGVAGFYDIIGETFYPSYQTSYPFEAGPFIAGPAV